MTLVSSINPSEAPIGFYAVLKSSVATKRLGNVCRACDWRSECQKPDADFEKANHRCMSSPVRSFATGLVIQRNDGCGVVFKRLSAVISDCSECGGAGETVTGIEVMGGDACGGN